MEACRGHTVFRGPASASIVVPCAHVVWVAGPASSGDQSAVLAFEGLAEAPVDQNEAALGILHDILGMVMVIR